MRMVWMAVAVTMAACCCRGEALEIGDKAPPVREVKWLHGEGTDPAAPDGKTVYLVDFWTSADETTPAVVALLNHLHKRYRDKGLAILGVSAENPEFLAVYLAKEPIKYAVAFDPLQTATRGYMEGRLVPYAFIVGADGKILWHGNPLIGMSEALADILAGRYDAAAAKKLMEKEEEFKKLIYSGTNDMPLVEKSLDELIALAPRASRFYEMKAGMLMNAGRNAAARELFTKWEESCKDSSEGMMKLAMTAGVNSPLEARCPTLALRAARAAYDLCGGADPRAIMAKCQICFEFGLHDEAMAALEKGIGFAEDEDKTQLSRLLLYYQRVRAAARGEAEPPPPADEPQTPPIPEINNAPASNVPGPLEPEELQGTGRERPRAPAAEPAE